MKKLLLFIVLIASMGLCAQTTWTVDSLNDSGLGSLRAAADSCVSGDTIRFSPSLIANGSDSIVLTSGEIAFGAIGIVIIGQFTTTDTLSISGNHSSRIFSFSSAGRVVLDSLVLRNGTSYWSGGAIDFINNVDTIFVKNSFLTNNTSTNGNGGAISSNSYSNGANSFSFIHLENTVLSNNDSFYSGGAVYSNSNSLTATSISGVSMVYSSLSNNSSSGSGGGVYCSSESNSVDSTAVNLATVDLKYSTISNNISGSDGGGVYVFSDNFSFYSSSASVKMEYSTISDNVSMYYGGGVRIYAFSSSSPSNTDASIDLFKSTVSGNTAINNTGGGIDMVSTITSTVNVLNSTVAGNSGNMWGGIVSYANDSSKIFIKNSTITGNTASTGGGYGVYSYGTPYSSISVVSSIIAENGTGSSGIGNNLSPMIVSSGFNIFSDSPFGAILSDSMNVSSVNLSLTPLANNGGFTETMMPNWGSVAIDGGNLTDISHAQNVPIVGVRDIGAAEFCAKTYSIDSVYSCSSYYTWIDGNTYIENDTNSTFVIENLAGCDSVITLNLTLYSLPIYDEVHACDSVVWIDGITYYPNHGMVSDTLINVNGCDSVVYLNFIPSNYGVDILSSCDSLEWINGVKYYASNNTAKDTLVSSFGCDSVVTMDLTINYSASFTDVIMSCDSLIWINGVTYYSNTNAVTDTLVNSVGCDSVITLNLTIIQPSSGTEIVSACDSYTWNGLVYNSSNNTALDTLVNTAGCDSIVMLDLTILNSSSSIEMVTACDSLVWIDGITYYSSNNTAIDTLVNSFGCDSIVSLDLTLNFATTARYVITSCDSFAWINGVTYFSDTTDSYVWVNSKGCDSVITLDLNVNFSTFSTDSVIAVNQYTWIDGNTYFSSNNTATHVLQNTTGCDSVITLNLHIEFVELGIDQTWPNLTAQATFGTFQWVVCPNYDIIPGATDSVFTPTQNGNYAVIVTQNGFTDTSDCITVNNVSINETELVGISVYPNPTSDVLHIDKGSNKSLEITITNSAGAIVHQSTSKKQITTIDMAKMASGMYVVTLKNELGLKVEKVVKR